MRGSLSKEVDEEYRSGCESLFYTPRVYRRVRHLTAGRHGFIIPGVLSKTDVLIAGELRTPILGPCLKFQERLLSKFYVMSVLAEAGLRQPPFVGVRNFRELCERMAEMAIKEPRKREAGESKWMLKVNCGFCGNQSALVCLERRVYRFMAKEDLQLYLALQLPDKLQVSKRVYNDAKEFFVELERHGGVLTACPEGDYRTVSLGCFIEHDTAKARLRTSADVLRTRTGLHSCSWSDFGYVIPQTSLPEAWVEQLVARLGDALSLEQHIGFFGVDILVFRDRQQVLDYWVVDIDPYYTDLLSFDDWRRFCLNIPICASFSPIPDSAPANSRNADTAVVPSEHRFVVCSGQLRVDGLSTLASDAFLRELCDKHRIAYSHKARTGCMICPIDSEKRTYLLFSFCRSRVTALRHFVRALKALHSASVAKSKPLLGPTVAASSRSSNILSLARDVERLHDLNSTTTSSPATDETTGRWKTAGSDSSRRYHRQGSR
ncbi:IQ domain-containing protein H-like isoform X2 [Phymastichus coffea]|uniref:IQ domain-containing protein H-like isoform X2 n=1 Tax=Phymastichus coffea TaxID=108790 RepID=UPI00273C05F7|nr:IQ domain-containing protein H-like isoform X2 [Phymastichus coffea]